MALIERAKIWFKGDGVPQPVAGLMVPIDVDRLAEELRLSARGQESAALELPAAASTTPDAVEEEIVGRIMEEWSLQRDHLISMLKAYRDRLAELNAVSEIAQLRLAAASAITKFKQHKQEARGDLARLAGAYVEARNELAEFRLKHKLKRPPRDPSGRWTTKGAPHETIKNALASAQAARQAGADAKMGGQVREQVAVLRETEQKLNQRLKETFGDKLKAWGGEIDPANMTLRLTRPDLLFESGSATLRPGFQDILNQFFPEYLRILYEFRGDLEEVRIEGHTSSEWAGEPSPTQAYFRNMGLSQDRTRAVLEYGLTRTQLPPSMADWARKLITANGLSSSRPREQGGMEDKDASRRVEFRVLTRAKEQLLKIIEPGPR